MVRGRGLGWVLGLLLIIAGARPVEGAKYVITGTLGSARDNGVFQETSPIVGLYYSGPHSGLLSFTLPKLSKNEYPYAASISVAARVGLIQTQLTTNADLYGYGLERTPLSSIPSAMTAAYTGPSDPQHRMVVNDFLVGPYTSGQVYDTGLDHMSATSTFVRDAYALGGDLIDGSTTSLVFRINPDRVAVSRDDYWWVYLSRPTTLTLYTAPEPAAGLPMIACVMCLRRRRAGARCGGGG